MADDGPFGRATAKIQLELQLLQEAKEPGMLCTPMQDDPQRHFTVRIFRNQ